MKTLITTCFIAVSLAISAANIVLIGDSTLAPRDAKTKLGSWGDALKPSLAPGNGIINRSVGGRTVRTTKPSWAKSLEMISKGDFVIIQFGINDANKKKLVSNAGYGKAGKADDPFKLTASRRTYGDYAKALAAEKKLAYVDMTALTAAELAKIGKDKALALYTGETMRKGKPAFDTTHPSKAGAKRFAELFIADVKAQKLPVAELFK